MPFGLKNVGATYQRMITRMFRDKIETIVEVYIDDMVIKSRENQRHIEDLMEVFEILKQHKLHLNTNKCAFGLRARKFLRYMIMHRGIKVNSDQISTIERLKPPSNPKDIQKLTGMIASLNRFMSKLADKCLPFYQLLKKWKEFQWMEECKEAFPEPKKVFGQPTDIVLPASRGGFIYVSCNVQACCECRIAEESRGSTEVDPLYQ